MSWYYADNGRQAGPIDDASLDALITQGAVRPDTLVWREGMANWQALSSVRPAAAPAAPPAPVFTPPAPVYNPPAAQQPAPGSFQEPQPQVSFQPQQQPQPLFQPPQAVGMPMGTQGVTCANCGQQFAQSDVVFIGSSYVCAGCKPIFLQRMREGSAGGAVGSRRYAGFWIRVASYLIDVVIVYVAMFVVGFVIALPFGALFGTGDAASIAAILSGLVGLVFAIFYHGYFVSTKGGTPGKLLLGLRIIRSDGSNLTFGRAVGRVFAYMVSAIILYIGFILAAFDAEKRCLHDHLCDTRVIYK
jgi:uncharacterized RDD family membrane protein YckC